MAAFIWADVAPGLSVAQILLRFGMPPITPGVVWFQLMPRLGSIRLPEGDGVGDGVGVGLGVGVWIYIGVGL